MSISPKKVLWIIFAPVNSHRYNASVGQLYACLSQYGHKQKIITLPVPCTDNSELISQLRSFKPDVVALNVYSFHRDQAIRTIKVIKKSGDYRVICGGVHVRLKPMDLLDNSKADHVCNGEGEVALIRWLQTDYADTPGIISRAGVRKLSLAARPNINKLPNIKIALFDANNVLTHGSWEIYFKTLGYARVYNTSFARGCINTCGGCCNKALTFLNNNVRIEQGYRLKTIDYLDDEISKVNQAHGIDLVYFWDEHLPALPYLEKILKTVKHNGLSAVFSCAPHNLTEGQIKLLARYGSPFVVIILLSADTAIREKLALPLSLKDLQQKYTMLRENGIKIISFVNVGLPGENWNNALNNYNFCASTSDFTKWVDYKPLPGAAWFESLAKKIQQKIIAKQYSYQIYAPTRHVSRLSAGQFQKITAMYDDLEINNLKNIGCQEHKKGSVVERVL